MNYLKLYLTSGIFIGVTVLKLMLPEQTSCVRQAVVKLIDMDMDYRNMMVQAGTLLTDESVQQVIGFFREEPIQEATETEDEITVEITESSPPCVEFTPVPSIADSGTIDEGTAKNVLEAIEAFRMSQQEYAEYATPDTVSYANLCIPFSYISPVEGVTSSGFGYRVHPIEGGVRFHYGTDFAAEEGTPILSFADGEVSMTGYEKGYGNFVEITHEGGWKTLYAHCSEVKVNWYQRVNKGDVIALAGATGGATGPHLHLELTHNGYYTNPEFFF